ncbi:tetraacyldisaccharide 4'-kinase [Salinimicrobium flavum]|uniref:Tetraacyldisaccharide 4'-kinase n=1 Tax=Salinimicrobium flavum TaxID=1737065 RepID=A0ABW5IU04_9FLAO
MSAARKLLYPFSLLYGGVMLLRNKLYDRGIFSSEEYELPVIAVGNLSVGGTGKTPMVEHLITLLAEDYRVATLSRGYKRSSSGFRLVTGKESAAEVGDEPLQFKTKFPKVMVAVDEVRTHGIGQLLNQAQPPEVIILDDAFQHRKVKAGFYILLTPYNDLYSDDLVLPAGNLREPKSGARRADVVVVTKCPPSLEEQEKKKIADRLKINAGQDLYFSSISYSDKVMGIDTTLNLDELKVKSFVLVTGIANPAPLVKHLKDRGLSFEHKAFPDHHNFTAAQIKELQKEELLLTTEKDFMRLKNELPGPGLFYLPITTEFLGDRKKFENSINSFVRKF